MRTNNYHKRVVEVSSNDAVTRIEVEKVIVDDEDIVAKYYRTVRFTTDCGEVLEVSCDVSSAKRLEIVEVDQLGRYSRRSLTTETGLHRRSPKARL